LVEYTGKLSKGHVNEHTNFGWQTHCAMAGTPSSVKARKEGSLQAN